MLLKELVAVKHIKKGRELLDKEICDISIDSRKTKPGDIFFAMKGWKQNGNDYVLAALKNGAEIVVSEQDLPFDNVVIVDNVRAAYAKACKNFFESACDRLKLIGITGTNGKTTTTNIVASILKAAGKKVGVIGTLGAEYNQTHVETGMTTPDPYMLHKLFKSMFSQGIEYAIMEVSAHALALDKLEGIKFEIGVLTNITEDHLDYFENMENYAKAKMSFFRPEKVKLAIVFGEDDYGKNLIINPKVPTICYGKKFGFDVSGRNIKTDFGGSEFVCDYLGQQFKIKSHLVGQYNVENLLGAIAVTRSLGISEENVSKGIANLLPVEGRFNILNFKNKNIVIDYAHTPDGLEKVLKTARSLSGNKLVCIFGCGGNRDKQKRPIMGKIASSLADDVIITSDNPRFEEPQEIIKQIENGCVKPCLTICERQQAIEYALKKYKNKTTIVIAGKGAEQYQEIKGVQYPYSDFEVVYNFCKQLKKPLKKDKTYPFDDADERFYD